MNNAITYEIRYCEEFVIIKVKMHGIITPKDLITTSPPHPGEADFGHKGVVLFGSMTLWLCAFLTHSMHATLFVAIYDPRLKAAVVCATHSERYHIGDLIPIQKEMIA